MYSHVPSPSRTDRRLRIAELCVGIAIVILLLALLLGADAYTDEQLHSVVSEEVAGAVKHMTYEAGDTYEITVTSENPADLLAASRGLLSAVRVEAAFSVRDGSFRPTAQRLSGAGVIYRLDKDMGDAYVITNYHVIYSADATQNSGISEQIDLYLYGMELEDYAIPATFVGGSPYYDIAVLKVTASPILRKSSAVAATFADSDDVSVLETAIAIGNPASGGIAATVGHVNVDSEQIDMPLVTDERQSVRMRVIRIDTAVNSGNSGGGLFNDRGEIIGIVNAKIADTSVENIGYAIPSNVAKGITENILYYCDGTDKTSAYRCLLGITVAPGAASTVYDTETGKVHIVEQVVITEEVPTGSLAYGKLKKGDVLTAIRVGDTAREVSRTFHIVDAMLNARTGDTVTVTYRRAGTEGTATFTVTSDALSAW